jgi:hypothetical protein
VGGGRGLLIFLWEVRVLFNWCPGAERECVVLEVGCRNYGLFLWDRVVKLRVWPYFFRPSPLGQGRIYIYITCPSRIVVIRCFRQKELFYHPSSLTQKKKKIEVQKINTIGTEPRS